MTRLAYTSIASAVEATVEVKRSRFLARIEPVTTEDEARDVVEAARRAHWDARHHCSAFVLGPDGATRRSSDDGEPSGTAGTPILDVLTGRGLTDVVAVVTRWFGGTLLGTGGLLRAYSDAALAALENANTVTYELHLLAAIDVPIEEAGRLDNLLRTAGYVVDDALYGPDRVTLRVSAATERIEALPGVVAAATGCTAAVETIGEAWARA